MAGYPYGISPKFDEVLGHYDSRALQNNLDRQGNNGIFGALADAARIAGHAEAGRFLVEGNGRFRGCAGWNRMVQIALSKDYLDRRASLVDAWPYFAHAFLSSIVSLASPCGKDGDFYRVINDNFRDADGFVDLECLFESVASNVQIVEATLKN